MALWNEWIFWLEVVMVYVTKEIGQPITKS